MNNRQIVFTSPRIAELLNQPMPLPKPGEVLVKTVVSSVSSGTERANVIGDPAVSIFDSGETAVFPRTAGYSASGIVAAVGTDVQSVVPGDRVALFWSKHQLFNCLPESQVVKLESENISFSAAALAHIGCFPLAAIRKCRLEIGESALVMGQGILGQLAVLLLRAAGAAPVIAADPDPAKRERAIALGADYALDPLETGFAEEVKRLTGGGAHVAIEVTGVGAGLNGALDCMRRFGRIALLGCTRHSDFTVDYYRKVHGPGISLIGAHTNARPSDESSHAMWTTRDDMLAQLKMLELGRLDYDKLVQETHSPAQASEIYRRLCEEKTFPVVQFDWRNLE